MVSNVNVKEASSSSNTTGGQSSTSNSSSSSGTANDLNKLVEDVTIAHKEQDHTQEAENIAFADDLEAQ